jgi:F-type H+-transporting ATPase subunit delta
MANFSRRQLAEYAANQLLDGEPVNKLAPFIAAALIESKKSNDTELLAKDIAWELENRNESADANITSAVPLTESLRAQISKIIKEKTGVKDVNLQENIDETVLGGVKIETATHTWDKTIARQLAELKESLA